MALFRRASDKTDDDGTENRPRMTSEQLRKMTIEHAGDNHHVNPWYSGFGSGFFGGGLGGGGAGGGRGGAQGTQEAAQAKSRLVNVYVFSGCIG